MTQTMLDRAHAAMTAAPDEDAPRLSFYARMADAVLFLLLETEAEGDTATPRVFELPDGPAVLVFDTEERLAELAGAAPYVELPGRTLVELLRGQGLCLGLNLGVAPSEHLMDPAAVDWLAEMLDVTPAMAESRPAAVAPPGELPPALLTALDAKLSGLAGAASHACLARVSWMGGGTGHLLAFVGAAPGAEEALARAVAEALAFSGLDAGEIHVACLTRDDPLAARLETHALRFDLPAPEAPAGPSAPGSDPARPPRLR